MGLGLLKTTHMHDQGIEVRPLLRGKDFRDSAIIGGIRTQAIDGLCREGDKFPRL